MKTVWEKNYLTHHIYNVDEVEWSTKDHMKQTITRCEENRFTEDYVTWFVAKDDSSNLDNYINGDDNEHYMRMPNYFYKEEKDEVRRSNYDYYRYQLYLAQSLREVKALGMQLYTAKERATISWTNKEGEDVTASILFPTGHLALFWEEYNAKKEVFLKDIRLEHKDLIEEIESAIAESSDKEELEGMVDAILQENMPYEFRKELVAVCSLRIEAIA